MGRGMRKFGVGCLVLGEGKGKIGTRMNADGRGFGGCARIKDEMRGLDNLCQPL